MCLCQFVNWILRKLTGLDARLPIPGYPYLHVFKESEMGLHFKVCLPEVPALSDVEWQELTVTVADKELEPLKLPRDTENIQTDDFVGRDGDEVRLSLVHIDGNDNRSVPREVVVTLIDTIPPAQPGEFSLYVTDQTFDELDDDDDDELTELEDDEVDEEEINDEEE